MDVYTCIIVDDSELDQLSLQLALKHYPQFKILGVFASAEKALHVVEHIKVDVLFLDVQMPGINGIEFRKKLQGVPVCVFISHAPEYAVDGFEVNALDYIVKPLRTDRFSQTVERIESYMQMLTKSLANESPEADEFFLKNGAEHIRINKNELLYLQAAKDYTEVVCTHERILVSYNLKELLNEEAFRPFVRIHKSYAVFPLAVYKTTTAEVVLKDGTKLAVGRTYKANLNRCIEMNLD